MLDYSKIAILTTVINFELYNKTSKLFPLGIKKYVIDGRNGMHGIHSIKYMMRILKGKGIQWLIMVDEDVIFQNSSIVFHIIEEMKSNNMVVAGIRDGGMISHRNYNPFVINTFFSILNFTEIKNSWNRKEVLKNQYIIKNEFDDNLLNLKESYDVESIYEPYYCFYLWLKRKKKKFLFLESKMHDDKVTNTVLFNSKPFLNHTWYARSYGVNSKHTKRIDTILNDSLNASLKGSTYNTVDYILYKDKLFYIKSMFKKMLKKVSLKINEPIIAIIIYSFLYKYIMY